MNDKKDSAPAGKNPLEWSVFAFSALLVVGVMAVLACEAWRWQDRPASLHIEAGEAEVREGSLQLPVKVSNRGDTVAVNVNVRISARGADGGRSVDLSFDFIPRGATREGCASFPADQDPKELEVRVAGYELP